jgi:flagellar basal body L-ring protein FlgH
MNAIYKDFENQEQVNAEIDNQEDGFNYLRNTKRKTSSVYNNPNKSINSNNQKYVEQQVKRQYKDEKAVLKRTTASDFEDNGSDGSLWVSSDPNSFLFTQVKSKATGDLVQINVGSKLKEEITLELKKAFPDNPFEAKAQSEAEKKDGGDKKTAAAPAAGAASPESEIKDKISSVIVEEINREHLLIKGRKNVLYKNRKRMVEIQALVSRKDINNDDIVNSDSILESNISIVR